MARNYCRAKFQISMLKCVLYIVYCCYGESSHYIYTRCLCFEHIQFVSHQLVTDGVMADDVFSCLPNGGYVAVARCDSAE